MLSGHRSGRGHENSAHIWDRSFFILSPWNIHGCEREKWAHLKAHLTEPFGPGGISYHIHLIMIFIETGAWKTCNFLMAIAFCSILFNELRRWEQIQWGHQRGPWSHWINCYCLESPTTQACRELQILWGPLLQTQLCHTGTFVSLSPWLQVKDTEHICTSTETSEAYSKPGSLGPPCYLLSAFPDQALTLWATAMMHSDRLRE